MTKNILTFMAILVFSTSLCLAHSGGLDANGGHHDRKNGGYHYHQSKLKKTKSQTAAEESSGKVVGVSDGDTITILTADKKEIRIRLANIDAPEKKQAFGMAAKEAMSGLIYGKTVEVRPQTVDKYGRTVAVVLMNGVDVNALMVTKGLAWVYVKYNQDPSLVALEAEARESKRGLWADDNPIPPWEWRSRKTMAFRVISPK